VTRRSASMEGLRGQQRKSGASVTAHRSGTGPTRERCWKRNVTIGTVRPGRLESGRLERTGVLRGMNRDLGHATRVPVALWLWLAVIALSALLVLAVRKPDDGFRIVLVATTCLFTWGLTQPFPRRWADRRWWGRVVAVIATSSIYSVTYDVTTATHAVATLSWPEVARGAVWLIWAGLCVALLLVRNDRDRWYPVTRSFMVLYLGCGAALLVFALLPVLWPG